MIPMRGVAGIGGDAGGAKGIDPRLKPAAHEFEACLMKEFLQPLTKDALFTEAGEGGSTEESGNALMSFGSEALARAISERGGLGIAKTILGHFGVPGGSAAAVVPHREAAKKKE
jgi:Rod binding domain-containing protein